MGVLENQSGQANCLLLDCRETSCLLREKPVTDAGVVSIELMRARPGSVINNFSDARGSTTSPTTGQNQTTGVMQVLSASTAPAWAIGLAIVIAVVCTGLNLGMLTAYLCHRRYERNKSSQNLSSVARNVETLHAYSNSGAVL